MLEKEPENTKGHLVLYLLLLYPIRPTLLRSTVRRQPTVCEPDLVPGQESENSKGHVAFPGSILFMSYFLWPEMVSADKIQDVNRGSAPKTRCLKISRVKKDNVQNFRLTMD